MLPAFWQVAKEARGQQSSWFICEANVTRIIRTYELCSITHVLIRRYMAKQLDVQVVNSAVLKSFEEILSKVTTMVATTSPETKTQEIVEYDNRMRISGMEKFSAPSYISAVNYYLNQGELEKHHAKGVLIVYVDTENASKLYKGLGFQFPDDEDDNSMLEANAKFCQMIAEKFNSELASAGYGSLVMSAPSNYKNNAIEGVEFSPDQKQKQEYSFFYWKRKTIVVEVSMADIPRK